jgi:RNA polymerase sigma factor (sigma-70 family)
VNVFSASSSGLRRDPVRTDAALVAACLGGDREAFVHIVQRYQSLICAVAYNATGRLPLSEDIAQDTFVRAWKRLAELREPEKLRGWLCTIASSVARNTARAEKPGAPVELLDTAPSHETSPDESAAVEEENALVWRALDALPEQTRLPLILFYREGESIAAVARILELSEDAVKQRLSRGRALLRERMAGLAESVLGRSRPTTVFTFGVMAAIGALAVPAKVAHAAISGLSANSASTTTAVTAMTASKTSFAAALVAAALLPLGYIASQHLAAGNNSPAESVRPAAAPPAAKMLPNFKDSALYAEWHRLHEEHGATKEAMPALFKAINEIKDTFRRRAFRAALVAEWVQLDMPGALTFFRSQDDGHILGLALHESLRGSGMEAMRAFMATGPGWEGIAKDFLTDIAAIAPEVVPAIIAQLPSASKGWDHSVKDAFTAVALHDLAQARTAAEALTGGNRADALAGVAAAWGGRDPQAAMAWARTLPDVAEKNAAVSAALIAWAKQDPFAVLGQIELSPAGGSSLFGEEVRAGAEILAQAGDRDFEGTMRWLKEHPDKIRGEALSGLQRQLSKRLMSNPAETLEYLQKEAPQMARVLTGSLMNEAGGLANDVRRWLDKNPSTPFSKEIRSSLIMSMAWREPQALVSWVQEMPAEQKTPEKLSQVALTLINQGSDMNRIEDLIAKSPPELSAALVLAAFDAGSNWPGGDVKPWIARLDQVPAEKRPWASSVLAGRWAATDPDAAVAWAGQLTDETTRVQSYSSIASRWAKADSYETSEWITSLPEGSERDGATGALVKTIARDEPDSAFTWAQTIRGPQQKLAATTAALEAWAQRDPAGAMRQLEASALSPESKETLRQKLSAGAKAPNP